MYNYQYKKMKKYISCLLLLFTVGTTLLAGSADTVSIFSSSMQKNSNCIVIKPDSYKKKKNKYPVLYLLHGYSGNYSDWIRKVPELQQYVDEHQLLIVCPDGGYSSWYFDSPIDSTMRYETYIIKEVVPFIDNRYRTKPSREHRAITGLSMGGHGSFFLAWRHSDLFGSCGSMSGGVDLNSSRLKFDISKRIGDTLTYAANWQQLSVINVIEQRPAYPLVINFDCGTEDFYYDINLRLHQKMLRMGIAHQYTERPGQHNWQYWKIAIAPQLLFFNRYFTGKPVL